MVIHKRVTHHVKSWLDGKTISTLLVTLVGILGTRHEELRKTESEDDRVTAVASLAQSANDRDDDLQRQISMLKFQLAVLRARARKAGIKEALAEDTSTPIKQENKPSALSRFWHGLFH